MDPTGRRRIKSVEGPEGDKAVLCIGSTQAIAGDSVIPTCCVRRYQQNLKEEETRV